MDVYTDLEVFQFTYGALQSLWQNVFPPLWKVQGFVSPQVANHVSEVPLRPITPWGFGKPFHCQHLRPNFRLPFPIWNQQRHQGCHLGSKFCRISPQQQASASDAHFKDLGRNCQLYDWGDGFQKFHFKWGNLNTNHEGVYPPYIFQFQNANSIFKWLGFGLLYPQPFRGRSRSDWGMIYKPKIP